MAPVGLAKFTIFEAEYALYLADAAGTGALGEVFLGGSPDRISLEGSYGESLFQYQGSSQEEVRHISERHAIEIVNPIAVQLRPAMVPRLGSIGDSFNRRYILVIVWRSRNPGDRNAWFKRSYYGLTAQPVKLDGTAAQQAHGQNGGPVMHQVLHLSAQHVTEISGSGTIPSLEPVHSGEVRYVDADGTMKLYDYAGDEADGEFTAVDPVLLDGRATLAFGDDGVDVTIGGTLALRATGDGVLVNDALDGQTFADAVPRLEFWCNGVRRGSLTQAGLIAALGFSDADAPADSTALRFKDNEGRLLFTMGAQMFAPAFSDALP